nr:MAG TPA: DNA methyltransferase [Caudoviricetes sp.]
MPNKKMIVWALFDSGNGSYTKGVNALNNEGGYNIDIYPIGIDIENKNNHFINLNLADYSRLFGNDVLFNTLDKLPKPDLIIASPPCESWSVASAMDRGNACWKQEQGDGLFEPQTPLSRFTIRYASDFEKYQYYPEKQLMKRINGELCAFNTIEIIKRYKPKFWIIENPAFGRLWEYIETVLGFKLPYENHTRYNNYDYPISKPTRFSGNIDLKLKNEKIPNELEFRSEFSKSYNERSNIPGKLVKEIFKKIYREFSKTKEQS